MAGDNSKITIKLPEPSLRRLPWYLAYVKLLKDRGVEYVSSTQISKDINVDASQIRIFRLSTYRVRPVLDMRWSL